MSSIDILLTVEREGNEFTFSVEVEGDWAKSQNFAFTTPGITEFSGYKELRERASDTGPVAQLQVELSRWLVRTGKLRQLFELAIQQPADQLVRLLVDVGDPDCYVASGLANLPIELLRPHPDGEPLVCGGRPASIVHLCAKGGNARPALGMRPPLRVLLVRSSPTESPEVPEAVPVREQLLRLAEQAASRIQIDLLTHESGGAEAGILGPPTYETVRRTIADAHTSPYHLLVFLGHGFSEKPSPKSKGEPSLLFEKASTSPDRIPSDSVNAALLSNLFQTYHLPVVLLISCFSGSPAPTSNLDHYVGGALSVAQTLVSGNTSIEFAIGMRHRLSDKEATVFIEQFFRSLLITNPGDLELAVYHGRRELRQLKGAFPFNWCAPMIFQTRSGVRLPTLRQLKGGAEHSSDDLALLTTISEAGNKLLDVIAGPWAPTMLRLPHTQLAARIEEQWGLQSRGSESILGRQIKLYRASGYLESVQARRSHEIVWATKAAVQGLQVGLQVIPESFSALRQRQSRLQNMCFHLEVICEQLEEDLRDSDREEKLRRINRRQSEIAAQFEDLRSKSGDMLRELRGSIELPLDG